MQRERITEDIYALTSDLYAQVTAGVIKTSAGTVIIDTLLYPEETLQLKHFVQQRFSSTVCYVVNTHYHADHTTGTCFFDEAQVIAHQTCRQLLDIQGRESLQRAKETSKEMNDVTLILPDVVFDERLTLHIGEKILEFFHVPGHSPDSIACLVLPDNVLFAADAVLPIPYFVDGSYDELVTSLQKLQVGNYETIVQGHGDVILRGEVERKLEDDLNYLHRLREAVDRALASTAPDKVLNAIDIETCGKSRVLLNGMVAELHRRNVNALAQHRRKQVMIPTE